MESEEVNEISTHVEMVVQPLEVFNPVEVDNLDLDKKSVKELKMIAKEKGMRNYSILLKNDLLKLIKSYNV